MLALMELPFIIAIALLAFVVPIAIWLLVERDRTLAAVRSAITRDGSERPVAEPRGGARATDRPGRPPARWTPYDPIAEDPAADLPTLVRRLRERLDASEL